MSRHTSNKHLPVGTVLYLNSDAGYLQPMTLQSIDGDNAYCLYFDSAGRINNCKLPLATLREKQETEPAPDPGSINASCCICTTQPADLGYTTCAHCSRIVNGLLQGS